MNISVRYLIAIILISVLLTGCSGGGNNPIAPPGQKLSQPGEDSIPLTLPGETGSPKAEIELAMVGNTFHSTGIIGAFDLALDAESLKGELTGIRSVSLGESYIVSGASFFTVQPCLDCLRIESVELTADGFILVKFKIDHPFEKGDRALPPSGKNRLDLDLFDLALVIVPFSASLKQYEQTGVQVYSRLVTNPDGYTLELSNMTENPHVCPYYLVVDDSLGTESTNNRFEMGTKDAEVQVIFGSSGLFRIYMTAGYGVSAEYETRLSPVYYLPEFNRKAAWKIQAIPPQGSDPPAIGNTWSSTDPTTEHTITVNVWDWQEQSIVSGNYPDYEHQDQIYRISRVDTVSVEIPGMTRKLKFVTNPVSGTGTPQDPLVYKIKMSNENLLAAGEYVGLVKVKDERNPSQTATQGEVDSLVHSFDGKNLFWYPMPEYATYQTFTATVIESNGITVTSPNGGEIWGIGSSRNITWTSTGTIANVNIELSINGGVNWPILIANNIANSGSFTLDPVGNWPTTQAKIRISDALVSSTYDKSDNTFTIQSVAPPVQVILPNGGETWAKGTPNEITWTAEAGIQFVKIELSQDSGTSYTKIVTGSTPNDGSFMWNIPVEAIGDFNRIKISKLTDASVYDESDNDFAVICPLPNEPATVTASDGIYPDKVVVTWSNVSAADDYYIYKDSVLVQSHYNGLSWNDTAVAPGVSYYYQVSAYNSCGEGHMAPDDPGESGYACILPVPPENVTATDGTLTDRVTITWDSVPGATSYKVYRDFSATPIAADIPAPPWSDTSVGLCESHDYQVTSVTTCGESDKSLSDSGYAEDYPTEPLNVAASDGDFSDRVRVTWNVVTTATTYNIYRNNVLYDADIGNVTTYDDLSVTPGINYNYNVEGENNCGVGPLSLQNGGFACLLPTDPTNVAATDGTFGDRINLSWDPVAGATGYNIYKDSLLEVNNYAGTSWDDFGATPGVTYYYQVEATNGCGPSALIPAAPGEPGWACELPDTPTGFTASDGTFNDRVELNWNAAAGATSYNVYRDAAFLINVPANTHDDMTAAQGVVYTYNVEAVNACGNSLAHSNSNDGYAYACIADTNNTCGTAEKIYFEDSVSGCVDMIDEDWFMFYSTPRGIMATSTIDLTIPAGTLDIYVYGLDPGAGACPGLLLTQSLGTGTASIALPLSTRSKIYVRLIGASGQVMYTMDTHVIPTVSNLPIQICVATDDGTPTGNWPYNGPTYLDLTILNNMINWANNFWGQYGYHLEWDGSTITYMASQYYINDNLAEENLMHDTYHQNNVMSLYFVQQLFSGNTAYCWTYGSQAAHNVNNVYTVYSPNVWTWQAVVSHEHGHGFSYFFDEYLYSMYSCACGDNGCLGYTPYLYWNDIGCYGGNLMYYDMGWAWSSYELTPDQNEYTHIFNYNNPVNFPWF
jgi:fibronectin type 3 domain-containing protein